MVRPVEVGGSPRQGFFWHGTCCPRRANWLYHWAGGRLVVFFTWALVLLIRIQLHNFFLAVPENSVILLYKD